MGTSMTYLNLWNFFLQVSFKCLLKQATKLYSKALEIRMIAEFRNPSLVQC